MNRFLYSLATIVLFCGACTQVPKENPGDTVISGTVRFKHADKIYLYGFADSLSRYLGNKTPLDTAAINQDGDFRFVIHPYKSNLYDLRLPDTALIKDMYIIPQSKLKIDFTEKYIDPGIDTENMAGKMVDYRVKLDRKFYLEKEVNQMYYISANYFTVNQFDTFTRGRRNRMLADDEHYFKDSKPGPDFDHYARSEINYQYGIDKLMYLWKKRIKNAAVFPDSSYYDFCNKTTLENPDALSSPAYYHFLNLYINNIYGQGVIKEAMERQQPAPANPPAEKFRIAVKNLNPPYRDIVLYTIITQDMNREELKHFKQADIHALVAWFKDKYPELK